MSKNSYKFKKYSYLIDLLDDDDTYILFFNIVPFTLLAHYVPISYLISRYDELKKKGLL